MMRVVPLLTMCLPVLPVLATASQNTRSHEPGVVVRLYDIGVGVRYIPELAPDQLPNVVKVMDTIELRTDRGDFAPLEDRFIAEVIANFKIEKPGTHRFRLISDDGSRLWIDDKLIIDHDGLQGPDPKHGNVELTAGVHTLRILHFESAGGEHLELQWCQPGAADDRFTLIPAGALTHDKGVSRETSPGTKKIIPPLRRGRPGDGTPVAGMHPSFDATEVSLENCDPGEPPFGGLSIENLPVVGEPMKSGTYPYAWLPAEIGRTSADANLLVYLPPHVGHQLIGGITTGSIFRFVPDAGGDVGAGCIFRFADRDPRGIRSIKLGSDATICVERETSTNSGVPAGSTWQRMCLNGKSTFEMAAVRAMTNGLEIHFTKPLHPRVGWDAESYYVEQWPYDYARGVGPRRDGSTTPVKSASVSPGRKRLFLEIDGLKSSHVIYLRLLPPCLSYDGELAWSTEVWYTLGQLSASRYGKVLPPPAKERQNFLTAEEKAVGWKPLFDGKTTNGWRGYKKDHFPDQGWMVTDDCIVRVGPGGGDICTVEQFDNFELKLEWRICSGGNSGIFYRVDEQYGWPWESGPEMQVLDNAEHADGRNPKTSAGSNYALHAPVRDVTEPVGFFNKVRIVADGPHIEYWLNGVKIVEYELESPEWEKLVAESKFRDMPHHGRVKKGRIVLQDHGDKVWYRNIEIRRLGGE